MSDAQSGKNIGSTFDKDNSEDQKKYFNNYYKTDINFNTLKVAELKNLLKFLQLILLAYYCNKQI